MFFSYHVAIVNLQVNLQVKKKLGRIYAISWKIFSKEPSKLEKKPENVEKRKKELGLSLLKVLLDRKKLMVELQEDL